MKRKLAEAFGGDEEAFEIEEFSFNSDYSIQPEMSPVHEGDLYYHEMIDEKFEGNRHFKYPVISPKCESRFSKGIILFHGLNEKSWDKYLKWAAELMKRLNCPIILFPIAYHINRAPKKWSDPRVMKDAVKTRLGITSKNKTTFANAALSIRLSASPEQFIYSGVQTFYDVRKLVMQIRDGEHPLFSELTKIDFFAYSIGAFLAEIILISNPGNLFTHTKLFVFAGGPTFDSMIGTSRYIMDLQAFKSLLKLKRKTKLKAVHRHLSLLQLPEFVNTWKGFYAMMYLRKGRKFRNTWLDSKADNLWLVALKNDKVMPAKKIVKTYKRGKDEKMPRVDVIDFPFEYTHENPFPLNDTKSATLVKRSMDVIMDKAASFYNASMVEHPEYLQDTANTEVHC
ncbi:MAG: DUF6051 family protein [Prolixibacteraceae bacterium]|nr:DUF6051 family protein [Prolixibacteraceae bacterium]